MIETSGLISGLMGGDALKGTSALKKPQETPEGSFGEVIGKMLENASLAAEKSSDLTKRLQMDDPTVSVEEAVLAMNSSSLQFTGLVQTRNKILQAYNDIMNMPV